MFPTASLKNVLDTLSRSGELDAYDKLMSLASFMAGASRHGSRELLKFRG